MLKALTRKLPIIRKLSVFKNDADLDKKEPTAEEKIIRQMQTQLLEKAGVSTEAIAGQKTTGGE